MDQFRMREAAIKTKLDWKKIVNGKRVDNYIEWELLKHEKDVIKLNKAFCGKNYLKISLLAFDSQSTVFDG